MAPRPKSLTHKADNHVRNVLGHSAATGRFVLKPVTKPGSISLAAAKRAVEAVRSARKI